MGKEEMEACGVFEQSSQGGGAQAGQKNEVGESLRIQLR